MKKALLSLLFFLIAIISSNAQASKSNLYKGTIDGKIAITFFIKTEENPCTADLMYTAMYRYDKSGRAGFN
ncbi:hypothetical protein D3C85_948420 [compost metagenome]